MYKPMNNKLAICNCPWQACTNARNCRMRPENLPGYGAAPQTASALQELVAESEKPGLYEQQDVQEDSICNDLIKAVFRGVSPPQNWTTRAIDEIMQLKRQVADLAALNITIEGCTRSHPHENMNADCERKTEIVRRNCLNAQQPASDTLETERDVLMFAGLPIAAVIEMAAHYAENGSKSTILANQLRRILPFFDAPAPQPTDNVTVEYDLSPAGVEGAIRDKLIALGWMPPQKPIAYLLVDRHGIPVQRPDGSLCASTSSKQGTNFDYVAGCLDIALAPLGVAIQQPIKDHEIAQAVNQLRQVAIDFHATQQLRSRIQDIVIPLLKRAPIVQPCRNASSALLGRIENLIAYLIECANEEKVPTDGDEAHELLAAVAELKTKPMISSELRNIRDVKVEADFCVKLTFASCRSASAFAREILGEKGLV